MERSTRISKGFDWLSGVYDALAAAIFRKDIRRAQINFLSGIDPGARVLILGGGTGWILEELIKEVPDALVWFVDSSPRMIERARARNIPGAVHFVQMPAEEFGGGEFDVVITPFFLDLFPDDKLRELTGALMSRCRPAVWLASDFVCGGQFWQRALLSVMYRMFRVVCGIEAQGLPAWREILVENGLKVQESESYYGGFILSAKLASV